MTWMQTRSGRRFDLLNPRAEDVCIEDVAFALARINRFTGHCEPYSVAEHSVRCAMVLRRQGHDERIQLAGLLHDAHEAYVGDVSRPLAVAMSELAKRDGLWRSHFKCVASEVENACRLALGWQPLSTDEYRIVKAADLTMLATEARDLLGDPKDWFGLPAPCPVRITEPWPPRVAEEMFRAWYDGLRALVSDDAESHQEAA